MIKERDEEARPLKERDILEEKPLSVATNRNLDEIAAKVKAAPKDQSASRPLQSRAAKAKPTQGKTNQFPKSSNLTKAAPAGDD